MLEAFRADEVVARRRRRARRDRDARRSSRTSRRCSPTSGSPRRRPAPPAQCAARVLDQFDAGADGVILHGATPDELAPVVDAYRAVRPAGRFDGQPANPGITPAFADTGP